MLILQKLQLPILVLLLAWTAKIWLDRKWSQTRTTDLNEDLIGDEFGTVLKLILINNFDKTHQTGKIAGCAILNHLLSQDTLETIAALEAQTEFNDDEKRERVAMTKMSKTLKSNINKEDKIVQVEFDEYQILTDLGDLQHSKLVAFKTTGPGGEFWWSLEKNKESFVMQRSNAKDAVIRKLEGNAQIPAIKTEEKYSGKCTMYNLLQYMLVHDIVGESYYLFNFNCQQLVRFLSKEKPTRIKSVGFISSLNSKYLNLTEDFVFASWPPEVALIYMNEPKILQTAYERGNFDIDGIYNQVTPLNWAIIFSKAQMIDHL